MITIKLMDNSDHANTVENWLIDYENENGIGINRPHVTEAFNGMGIYAHDNNTLIGGLTFRILNDWIFLCCGYVLPEYRGRSVYSTFIYELENMAVKQNLSGIHVSTYTFEAPRVYEHLGFARGAVLKDLPKGNTNIDYYKKIVYGHKPQPQENRATAPQKHYDTIAVDFDGTLCENRFPDIGEPKPLVIEYIKRQAAAGAKIILHTCRENGTRPLLREAIAFCAAQGIPLYAVNENPYNQFAEQYGTGTGRKVFADLYIDDKAANTADIERLMLSAQTVPARIADLEKRLHGIGERRGTE